MTTDTPLIVKARQWVIDKYPYNSNHLIKALEWLDRIAPDATEAMRLATLTHDMERAFPGPDQPVLERIDGLDEEDKYNRLHSARSTRFVSEWLRERDADVELIAEVERLILAHEIGGWPEANLVQAADSLSFLETNIDLFLGFAREGKRTLDEVAIKFFTTNERIQVPEARELALPMYVDAKKRLRQYVTDVRESDKTVLQDNYLFDLLLFGSATVSTSLVLKILSFDLRTPLNVAHGYAELVQETLNSQEPINKEQLSNYASEIEKNTKHTVQVLASLIHYEQISSRLRLAQGSNHNDH